MKSTSSKSLSLTFFLLSLIIHIQIIWQLSVIEKNEPHTVNNGFLISLSHKKTVLPPEAAVLADLEDLGAEHVSGLVTLDLVVRGR